MKPVRKSSCPPLLQEYAAQHPQDTWEDMRNNGADRGNEVYNQIRGQIWQDQDNYCAYCESEVDLRLPHYACIEHFHPKSDTSHSHNWALDWNNLLGVCSGGSKEKNEYGLPQNLTCDKAKKNTICDGTILNPLLLPPFPAAFILKRGTGELCPNQEFCTQYPNFQPNTLPTTYALLENTLQVLNLNCDRLCDSRRRLSTTIEHDKAKLREANRGAQDALRTLAKKYFTLSRYPFFTTVRYCLGKAAEDYLHSINFKG